MDAQSTPAPREIARGGDAYRFLMADADEAVYFFGEAIEDCNDATCRLLERTREQIIGISPLDITPPCQPDGSRSEVIGRSRFESAFAGHPQWFRWHYLKAGGRVAEALVHIELVRLDGRRRLLIRARDLLELERAEHAVAETETRFQQILDHTPVIAFAKDRAGRFVFANREFEHLMGKDRERLLGRTDLDLFPPQVAEGLRRNDQRVLEERRPIEFEETVAIGAEERTYLSIKFPILDKAGNATAVGGISTDITARKRADAALRRAALAVSSAQGEGFHEALVRALADVVGVEVVFVAIHDPDRPDMLRTLAMVADGCTVPNMQYPIAGTPCAEVCGRDFMIIESGVYKRYPNDPMLPGMRVTGYAGFPLIDAAGRSLGLIALMSRQPLKDHALIESMTKIFAVRAAAEIERSRTERALRSGEEQYRAVFNAAVDGLALWDGNGRLVDVNPAYAKLFGEPRDRLIGVDGLSILDDPACTRCNDLLSRILQGDSCRLETKARRADGTTFDAEIHGVLTTYENTPHVLVIVRDLTEQALAEAEKNELAAQLRQAQKMEALGHLTGGIAHDFNNLLAGIMGNIALAADRENALADPRLSRYLEQAMLSSKKARDLVRQMLTYSRGLRGERRLASLPSLMRQAMKLLRSSLPATVEIVQEPGHDAVSAMIDAVQIEQVLLNLGINARDAMRSAGTIRFGVFGRGAMKGKCASCREKFEGDFVELLVADNGPGIPDSVMERMFEPYYTTKGPGEGSGLGLSTVHGAVHDHQGHIVVETERDRGATFRVFLPACEAAEVPAPQFTTSGRWSAIPQARLAGHVLLVDDEEVVLTVMRELLEGWGLAVTTANGGRAALALFESDPARFDLLITDQTMPHVTGLDLARQAALLRPGTPIVLCTGYGGSISQNRIGEAGIRALLAKPVEPRELLVTVETCLASVKMTEGLEK